MKKSFAKIISIITFIVLLFSGTACNNSSNNSSQGGGNNIPDDKGGDIVVPEVIPNEYIMYNTKSDYKIVVPDNAENDELTAASEFVYFMQEATGFVFDTLNEKDVTFSDNSKFIYLGNTNTAANLGFKAEKSKLKSTGYIFRTSGKSLFVVGATPIATIYGIYDLLNILVGYECYAYDDVYVDKNVKNIFMYNLNVDFTPTIEERLPFLDCIYKDVMVNRRMKSTSIYQAFVMFDSSIWVHTCDRILPYTKYGNDHKDWYSTDGTQWCFSEGLSNEDMFNTVYENIKAEVIAQPLARYVSISQNDIATWCTCDRCKAEKDKYGSNLAVVVKFCNKIAKKLKTDFPNRDLFVHTFSYHLTSSAITYIDDEVICEPNVTIMFAPIRANYTTGFSDSKNEVTYDALESIGKICHYVTAWTYDAHFGQFFVTYNSFTGRQDRYDCLSKNNVGFIFEQNMGPGIQSFSVLKAYLTSKLSWNNNLNMQTLVEKFCKEYYKTGANAILEYLDSYREWSLYAYNELGMHTDINGNNYLQPKLWPLGKLLEWQSLFEKAFNDIEILKWTDKDAYEIAKKHITIESLTYRYLLISLYNSVYKEKDIDTMKRQFRSDCYEYGVTLFKEATSVDELFTQWGI